jgi:hypothetical protein
MKKNREYNGLSYYLELDKAFVNSKAQGPYVVDMPYGNSMRSKPTKDYWEIMQLIYFADAIGANLGCVERDMGVDEVEYIRFHDVALYDINYSSEQINERGFEKSTFKLLKRLVVRLFYWLPEENFKTAQEILDYCAKFGYDSMTLGDFRKAVAEKAKQMNLEEPCEYEGERDNAGLPFAYSF